MAGDTRKGPVFAVRRAETERYSDLRWTRTLAIPVFMIAVLAGLGLSRSGWQHIRLHFTMGALRDQARKAGQPVNLDELNDWYPTPPDQDNAAAVIVPHLSELNAMAAGPRRVYGSSDIYAYPVFPLSAADVADWESFASEHRDVFDAIHAAADRPACRYPVDLSKGGEAISPSLQIVAPAVSVLLMDAAVHADQHRAEESARDLLSCLRLLRTLREQPQLLTSFVSANLHRHACRTFLVVLRRTQFTDAQLRALGEEFERNSRREPLLRAIAVERVMASNLQPDAEAQVGQSDDARMVAAMQACTNVLNGAAAAPYSRFEQLCADVDDYPMLYVPLIAHVQLVAQCRMSQTVAAIERYRLAHGSPPASLHDLSPQFLKHPLIDPAADQPFHYERHDQGYTLCSRSAMVPMGDWAKVPPNHPRRRLIIRMP